MINDPDYFMTKWSDYVLKGREKHKLAKKISNYLAENIDSACTDNSDERYHISISVVDAIEKAGYEILPCPELNDEINHSIIENENQ